MQDETQTKFGGNIIQQPDILLKNYSIIVEIQESEGKSCRLFRCHFG